MTKKACLLLIAAMLLFSITIKGLADETGTIEVTVRDENDNKPIEGVKISVKNIKVDDTFIIKTDEKGIARKVCAPGNYVVFDTSKEGYVTIGTNYRMSIIKNDINRIFIYLNVLPKISGTVLDQNDKGVEGASVQLVPRGHADILTDSSGKFEFKYDPISIQQYFIARHIKRNLAGSMQFRDGIEGNEAYSKDMEIKIKVEPAFTLKGKVTDPDNRAIPNAWVEADISTGSGAVAIAKCRVDENGQYSINALPVGHRCYIRTGLDGYGVMLKPLGEISTYRESIQVETIILQEANQTVTGIVVDANGNSVDSAEVRCWGEGQPERETKTDSDGKFIIRNVCNGPLRMAAIKGPMVTNVHTEGGREDLKIVLDKAPMLIPGTINPVTIKETPRTLVGKSLPQLDEIESTLNDSQLQQKSILLCFFDIEQRPSRNCILELNKKVEELKEKDVTLIAIQASNTDKDSFDDWIKEYNIDIPMGFIETDSEQTRLNWGVKALPWLIMTDNEHIVIDEGFLIDQLDEKINSFNK